MQALPFDRDRAETEISKVQEKLWLQWELQEYSDRQTFLVVPIILATKETIQGLIEFNGSIYKTGSVVFIPLWVQIEPCNTLFLSLKRDVLTANYAPFGELDLWKLEFFGVPYGRREQERGYTYNSIEGFDPFSSIDAIVTIANETIGWSRRIIKIEPTQ